MLHSRPVATPFSSAAECEGNEALGDQDPDAYRRAVGNLTWMISDRPDVSFVTKEAARHSSEPQRCHIQSLKRIMRYLQHGGDLYLHLAIDKYALEPQCSS